MGERSRVGKARDHLYEAEVRHRTAARTSEAIAKAWGRIGDIIQNELLSRGGRTDEGHHLRHVMVTMCLRMLEPHRKALGTAFTLGGPDKVTGLAVALLEPMLAHEALDRRDWVVMPMATGTRASGTKNYGEQEVAVTPLLFGRARITLGPVGRQFLDAWWEYPNPVAAVAALAAWQGHGYEGEPEGYERCNLRPTGAPLRFTCQHPEHATPSKEDDGA